MNKDKNQDKDQEFWELHSKIITYLQKQLEILDEIYVVGDADKTYRNVAEKIHKILNLLDQPKLN